MKSVRTETIDLSEIDLQEAVSMWLAIKGYAPSSVPWHVAASSHVVTTGIGMNEHDEYHVVIRATREAT